MKRLLFLAILLVLSLPVALSARQETPTPQVEITGVNATELPTVIVTANVYDPFGQPVRGLTEENFRLAGDLPGNAQIAGVQNVTDDDLPFSVVLVVDVSSSMEGMPMERAKEAAQAFVNAIGPNDPVAIYTFANTFELVQDFTSDKPALRTAIDSLQPFGRTGLYQGAYNAIDLAASGGNPRRAVILLSDGAEYGGVSQVGRGAALERAAARGVPVYTIGLGYGIDRTYLIELSEGTNAQFFESPTPTELTDIYENLASLLRSQYVLTLNADLPLDGTEYDLRLQVATPQGTGEASAVLRAPIPVPIVSLPPLPGALSETTTVEADIRADDAITQVDFQLDGNPPESQNEAPYDFTIDPVALLPGSHRLSVTVTDEQGDMGAATLDFEVAVLPPQVTIISNLADGDISSVQTVLLDVTGQTPPVSATYRIDGAGATTVTEIPFNFNVDPLVLTPGDHVLSVVVANQGGGQTTVEQPFSAATLAPYAVIVGLEEDQLVDAPLEVEVDVIASQTPVTTIEMSVNGTPLDNREIPPDAVIMSLATIDPMLFPPGDASLFVRTINESGGISEQTVDFRIAALKPVIVFENLTEGDELTENRDVGISFISQTNVIHVAYFLDGVDLAHRISPPWDFTLDVLELGPGSHSLRIAADNAGGEQSIATVNFTVSEAPALTATALAPTPTPSVTPTPTANVSATERALATITAQAEATVVAATQVALDITATEFAVAAAGTADARATGTAEALAAESALNAQATADAQSTMNAQAELNAQGTAFAQATRPARATANAENRATQNAQATLEFEEAAAEASETEEEAQVQATATAQAQATANAQETATEEVQQAQATATAQAQATATANAQETATEEVQQAQATATAQAQETATEQAQATAAESARVTVVALAATQDAEATATREAREAIEATERARATDTAIARLTREARLTETAEAQAAAQAQTATASARETQVAQAELNAQGTAFAQATRSARAAQNAQTATAEAAARATAEAQTAVAEQATESAQATATANAEATATEEEQQAQATATERAAATRDARASATAERRAELDAQATLDAEATATVDARATLDAQATVDTQLAAIGTEEITIEPTSIAQAATEAMREVPTTPRPTLTPIGTLVPVEAESQAADTSSQIIPILVVVVVAIIILIVIYLIIRGGRSRPRR